MSKRQPNFSGEEVELLISEVEKREKILFGRFAPGLSSAVKDAGWVEVAAKVSAVGGVKRTAEEVKKKWQAMKSALKGKAAELNRERMKTGGGPGVEVELTEGEQRVFGLLSKVVVEGIKSGIDSADDMLYKVIGKLSSY